ncbi:MAG: hypothetical protein MI750_02660 [Xanthomonadales bacterium]|nr:hypothetical protein [Xanthomonadales bacterium]
MASVNLLLILIITSIGVSFILIRLLLPLLNEILIETCGTATRSMFWIRFTQLMLVISPLLLVIYFTPTDSVHISNHARELKDGLFRILLGDFIALAAIGRVIAKSINTPKPEPVLPASMLAAATEALHQRETHSAQ